MELSQDNVKRIAELARLRLSNEEVNRYQTELLKILRAFNNLSNIPIPADLQGDARSALFVHGTKGASEDMSRMRQDAADNRLSTKDFLACAPDKDGVFVRVPAILERST